MDLSTAKNILLIVDEAGFKVKFQQKGKKGEHYFEIIGGNPGEKSLIDRKGDLYFTHENLRYSCQGQIFCTTPHIIVFIPSTPIAKERRSSFRYEMPVLPAHVKEQSIFPHFIPVSILNLSKDGAGFETSHVLPVDKKYTLEISLGLLNSPDFIIHLSGHEFYSTKFMIKSLKKNGELYIYGTHFEETSPEYMKTLGRFIEMLDKHYSGET